MTTISDPVQRAFAHGDVIDITTTGRRSGQPRRIEIVYHVIDGRIYISGSPRRERRSWLANLDANPRFTFHLKRGYVLEGTLRDFWADGEDQLIFGKHLRVQP